jgi:hypothetical protein
VIRSSSALQSRRFGNTGDGESGCDGRHALHCAAP